MGFYSDQFDASRDHDSRFYRLSILQGAVQTMLDRRVSVRVLPNDLGLCRQFMFPSVALCFYPFERGVTVN